MTMRPRYALGCLLWLIGCTSIDTARGHFDIWIANGSVVDGTGAPPRRADVLIRGDQIAWVGAVDPNRITAAARIDARGSVVAPGFIDAHAHGDPIRAGAFHNFLAMGVTTICLGQDGTSPGRGDLASWLRAAQRKPLGPNIVPFVGHGTTRQRANIDLAPDVSEAQLAHMEALIHADMAAGAFGLTTGLEYDPGRFASARELARVAQPVAAHDGVIMSHIRSEDDDAIDAALRELFEQCRSAGCAAHVSHLKIVFGHGAARADKILAILEEARQSGLQVTADVYPYLASYTGIGIVFPDWALPPHEFTEVVANRRDELAAYLRQRVTQRNGPGATMFGTGRWAGTTLAEVAARLDKPFEDVLIDDIGPQGASAAYFVMQSEVMQRFLLDPWVMVSSDGSPTMRHPRGHGAFARVIREFVVERERLSIEAAVRKMTSLPAATLGLTDRGRIAPGCAADIVVFEPAQVRDRATFAAPFELADGFRFVIVNGAIARREGAFTGLKSGRVLLRPTREP